MNPAFSTAPTFCQFFSPLIFSLLLTLRSQRISLPPSYCCYSLPPSSALFNFDSVIFTGRSSAKPSVLSCSPGKSLLLPPPLHTSHSIFNLHIPRFPLSFSPFCCPPPSAPPPPTPALMHLVAPGTSVPSVPRSPFRPLHPRPPYLLILVVSAPVSISCPQSVGRVCLLAPFDRQALDLVSDAAATPATKCQPHRQRHHAKTLIRTHGHMHDEHVNGF